MNSRMMISSVPRNIPITIDNITAVAVNGQDLGFNGYLDIGLYDTMEDLFVNFIGALTFSIIGYFYGFILLYRHEKIFETR